MIAIKAQIEASIREALEGVIPSDVGFTIERPGELSHGDFSTNVAMVGAKRLSKNPREFAAEIVECLLKKNNSIFDSIEVAGPGFINFRLSNQYFMDALHDALQSADTFGRNNVLDGKKVIVEYTDPNPFKAFHIGHLMSNTVGESVSRLIEVSGASTARACYQGDVGMHVATTVAYAILHNNDAILSTGEAYALGSQMAVIDPVFKERVVEVNKKIYAQEQGNEMDFYLIGRERSLEYFEAIYLRLGTNHGDGKAFNFYFFESNTGVFGKEVVVEHTPAIFEKSDGAVVYKGDESRGLHTRVFINKEGLPTYEAKELGLSKIKYDTYPYDISIIITGNEVNDYFRVLLDAMGKVFPDLAVKTEHYSHGMLRLPTGKMSSRTGDVITAVSLIEETKAKALTKFSGNKLTSEEKYVVAEQVAIGAIKYSILRQASGKDIIFDVEQSLSFEGDSGPYLQYTYARTCSLLAKAEGKQSHIKTHVGDMISPLHKYLLRFPEVIERAMSERESHYVATYLIELAREFNSFYGNTVVLDDSPDEAYKIGLVVLTAQVLKRGLWVLGIPAPERM